MACLLGAHAGCNFRGYCNSFVESRNDTSNNGQSMDRILQFGVIIVTLL
ncbi:hypothetical protein ATL17_0919 [Maritalea mobilis]|uniref:Uncharacterized protein n=1 Tax=Maritalea mobilis TaxID=483324 RepID=A0A4R6VSA0_9HYPH|nr:hypothetical protein ATL17_0919 [Maritalea mobilis]